jgi:hypothetical protein
MLAGEMDAVRRIVLIALAGLFSVTVTHADIMIGSKRADVIAELGKPSSSASRGAREILQYPKGVRIELEGGTVADIKGYSPPGAPEPTVTAAPSAPATVQKTVAPAPSTPTASPATAPISAAPKKAANDRDEDDEDEKEMEEDEETSEMSVGVMIGIAAVMLAAQFLLTFAALKIAFHYHQMDALWSGILAITAIDVGLQALIGVFLYFQAGEEHLGIAGTGLPGLVMIWSVRHFCLDQRWSRAFATVGAVKVASILLHLGLIVLIAQFGF